MILGKEIFAPTVSTADIGTVFDVNARSQVIYLAPDTGEAITGNDAYELRRIVDDAGRSIAQVDKDGAVLLGANRTQYEITIRGTYKLKKIAATTEAVGAYKHPGFEEIK